MMAHDTRVPADVEAGSVDIHTHLAPLLEERGKEGPTGGPPGLRDPAGLLAFLDECATERALVSVPPPFYHQDLDPEEARAWVRRLNEGILAAVDAPGGEGARRLVPLVHLPAEHPAVALAELARLGFGPDAEAAVDPRWGGFSLPAGGRSPALDADELAPLWEIVEAADLPVVMHPAFAADRRLRPHYLHNLLGNPVESGVATAELLFGGVLARHPRMRIAVVHCGGVLTSVLGRWQHGVVTDRPGVAVPSGDLHADARGLYVDTIAHDPHQIDHARALLGDERMLLGSDWPFAMGSAPRSEIAHLDAATQHRIAVTNAAEFLGAAASPRKDQG